MYKAVSSAINYAELASGVNIIHVVTIKTCLILFNTNTNEDLTCETFDRALQTPYEMRRSINVYVYMYLLITDFTFIFLTGTLSFNTNKQTFIFCISLHVFQKI